jgi:hypothetical protein
MEFDFMTVMAKAATDPGERVRMLTDPRTYLAENGMKLPAFVEVSANEITGMAPTISFGLPPMLDMDELSEEVLAVVGGGGSCCTLSCAT